MDIQKELNKIKASMHKWHKKDKGEWFPDEKSEGSEKEGIDELRDELLEGTEKIILLALYYEDMSSWKINQAQYALLYKEDKEQFIRDIADSTEYYFLAILQQKHRYLLMRYVGFNMAMLKLLDWNNKSQEVAETMLCSINQCPNIDIIQYGDRYNPSTWFVLDLFCLIKNQTYDKEKADLPKNYTPYDKVLSAWNTDDLQKVEQLVYLMAEIHVQRAMTVKDDIEQEFHWRGTSLFPFEILYWLKVRKEQGLENPIEFSHPLMQEPLAQFELFDRKFALPEIPHIELLKQKDEGIYNQYMKERSL